MAGCEGVCSTCPFGAIEEELKRKMKEQAEKTKKKGASVKSKAEKA